MLPGKDSSPHIIYSAKQDEFERRKSKSNVISKELVLKSPLALLNEICAKASVSPEFEYSEEGPVHNRIFSCKAKVDRNNLTWGGMSSVF